MSKAQRELGRIRASFGVVIGLFALAAGVGLRFFPEPSRAHPRLSSEIAWGALAVVVAAVLSAFISRPKKDFWIDLGLLPAVALVGLFMPIFGLMEPAVRDQLVPAGLECAGGFALVVSAIRFVRAHVVARLPFVELPKKQKKVRLRRENVKKLPEVPVASLVKGDVIELGTGEDLPIDGRVAAGSGFVDESLILGPSLPTPKKVGDPLFAGTHSSIPDLALEVGAPRDEAFVVRNQALAQQVARELIATARSGRVWAAVVLLLDAAGIALVLLTTDLSTIEAWVPPVLAILLGGVAAAPSLALMRGRAAVLSHALAHGLSFARAKDVTALARVRRWQIDPALLAGPGEVEAVALADTPPDALLQIAGALLESDGAAAPELISVNATLAQKKLPRVQGAALSRNGGVFRGTVDGKRYLLGPQQSLEETEKILIDEPMSGPIDFLRDKELITLLIAHPEEGVLGAIGIGLGARSEAKTAARELGATVMPGLSDSTRKLLAKAAEIECDGPPLAKRDATLLAVASEPPSDGLRLRVMPLGIDVPLPEGASPRLFDPAITNVGKAYQGARRIHRSTQLRTVILAILPALLATGLAYFGFAGGAVGAIIGSLAIVVAGRDPG